MMVWFVILVGIAVWAYFKFFKQATFDDKTSNVGQRSKARTAPGLSLSIEMVRPDPEEWAREREANRELKEAAVRKMMASFVKPRTLVMAFIEMENAISLLAKGRGVKAPDLDSLWNSYLAETPKKTELAIRKQIAAAYKLRTNPIHLVETLALCLIHAKFLVENTSPEWKISTSIKRLVSNLNHEKYRSQCIGFLFLFSDAIESSCPELADLCRIELEKLFSQRFSDQQALEYFEENLQLLEKASRATDKHFILNGIVGYLARRRRFDPDSREKLISYSEVDIVLYKTFLAEFASLGNERKTFEQALRSKYYMCPSLPSFNALWDLYEEEGNQAELRRLHKIAKEIRYVAYSDDDILATPDSEPEKSTASSVEEPCDVEVIEVMKSGQKGKLAFLDSEGEACSTEEAAQDHYRGLGYRVVRGEVQFWQAMFGLSFWEEIFEGTGAPEGFNDIPTDLFAGEDFYNARRNKIDKKFQYLQSTNIHNFISNQLKLHGKKWTRIIFDGGNGGFEYRKTLESTDVAEFLKAVDPKIFAKIVYRIAQNPTENRSGTPDYCIWKGGKVEFIEVKGVREKIRESQVSWLSWMKAEGFVVKVVRVKGVTSKKGKAA